ncbi:MAG: hypothetical protein ACI8VC_003037 [Candidatus Endobugula sp.]|jgi:hypothetical protein
MIASEIASDESSSSPHWDIQRQMDTVAIFTPWATLGINHYAMTLIMTGAGIAIPMGGAFTVVAGTATLISSACSLYRAYHGEESLGTREYEQVGAIAGIASSVQQNTYRQLRSNVGLGNWAKHGWYAAGSIFIPNALARINSSFIRGKSMNDVVGGFMVDVLGDFFITGADKLGDHIGGAVTRGIDLSGPDMVNPALADSLVARLTQPGLAWNDWAKKYGGVVGSATDGLIFNGMIIAPIKGAVHTNNGHSALGGGVSAVNSMVGELSFQSPIVAIAAIRGYYGDGGMPGVVFKGRRFVGAALNGGLALAGLTVVMSD